LDTYFKIDKKRDVVKKQMMRIKSKSKSAIVRI